MVFRISAYSGPLAAVKEGKSRIVEPPLHSSPYLGMVEAPSPSAP